MHNMTPCLSYVLNFALLNTNASLTVEEKARVFSPALSSLHIYIVTTLRSRHGVILICNHNRQQPITVFPVTVIVIQNPTALFLQVIIIIVEYIENVIVITF